MTDVNRYRMKCVTEDAIVYRWESASDPAPTTCPNDTGHTVDQDSIVIVEQNIEEVQTVTIKQWGCVDHTTAVSQERGVYATTADGVNPTIVRFSFEYPVDILGGSIFFNNAEYGDYGYALGRIKDDSSIGTVTANADADQAVVEVSDAVIANVKHGYWVKIGTEDKEYVIKSVDAVAKTLTLTENLTVAKSTDDPVRMRIVWCDKVPIHANELYEFGDKVFEPTAFPTTMEIECRYHHVTTPTDDSNTIHIRCIFRY